MSELKPCPNPWCDAPYVPTAVRRTGMNTDIPWSVRCDCGLRGPEAATEDEAIERWNTRTPSPVLDCTPTGGLGLPRWQYEMRAASAVLATYDQPLSGGFRKTMVGYISKWHDALSGYAALKADNERMKEALTESRRLCGQVPVDLASAHAEICKLQGIDPQSHTWPDWTPQANTLRWLDRLVPQIDEALK